MEKEHKGKPKGYVTPIYSNKNAKKVRAYRYIHRLHATRKGCAEVMGISESTVGRWWDRCAVSDDEVMAIKAVRQWMIDNRSDNNVHCAIALNRDPDDVALDMAVIHEWYDDRI